MEPPTGSKGNSAMRYVELVIPFSRSAGMSKEHFIEYCEHKVRDLFYALHLERGIVPSVSNRYFVSTRRENGDFVLTVFVVGNDFYIPLELQSLREITVSDKESLVNSLISIQTDKQVMETARETYL